MTKWISKFSFYTELTICLIVHGFFFFSTTAIHLTSTPWYEKMEISFDSIIFRLNIQSIVYLVTLSCPPHLLISSPGQCYPK